MTDNPTIFGKIINGTIPCNKVYEDDLILAFKDIQPRKKVHILIIPKQYIKDMNDLNDEDRRLMGHMMSKVAEIAELAGVKETGYRLITNTGNHSGQEVPHLHFHLLGGEECGPLVS